VRPALPPLRSQGPSAQALICRTPQVKALDRTLAYALTAVAKATDASADCVTDATAPFSFLPPTGSVRDTEHAATSYTAATQPQHMPAAAAAGNDTTNPRLANATVISARLSTALHYARLTRCTPACSSTTADGHQPAQPDARLNVHPTTSAAQSSSTNTASLPPRGRPPPTTTPRTATTAKITTGAARPPPLPDVGLASHKRDAPAPSSSSDRLTTRCRLGAAQLMCQVIPKFRTGQ
jgi:hypothetical protein